MMNDREKSDPLVVAMKPANKDGQPSAEPVERRGGAEGNAHQPSSAHTDSRERFAVNHPRWEPYAGVPHVRICAGGAQ
jgi:hypothetical protein